MLIVISGPDYEIFQLPSDGLYYWRGLAENKHIDSPKGYRTKDEAFEACIDTIEASNATESFKDAP